MVFELTTKPAGALRDFSGHEARTLAEGAAVRVLRPVSKKNPFGYVMGTAHWKLLKSGKS
jgi:hypothetical protein